MMIQIETMPGFELELPMPKRCMVFRHGGNSNHRWRCVLETDDPLRALQSFENYKTAMRQGGLCVVQSDGFEGGPGITSAYTAPRLRTLW